MCFRVPMVYGAALPEVWGEFLCNINYSRKDMFWFVGRASWCLISKSMTGFWDLPIKPCLDIEIWNGPIPSITSNQIHQERKWPLMWSFRFDKKLFLKWTEWKRWRMKVHVRILWWDWWIWTLSKPIIFRDSQKLGLQCGLQPLLQERKAGNLRWPAAN